MTADRQQQTSVHYLVGHTLLERYAYRRLLEHELDWPVAVDSSYSPTAVWSAMRARPHVVLALADMPVGEVIEAVQMIARLRTCVRILVVSSQVDPGQVEAWGRCPLAGYVVKDGGVEELRRALDALRDGKGFFSTGIRASLERGAERVAGAARLSRRESELLPLLARGCTLREAAERMEVSYKTADSYRTSLLRKLGVHDRVQLTRYAIRHKIIEP